MSDDQSDIKFTFEDILRAEVDAYIIRVGKDLLSHKSRFAFTRKVAETLYIKLWAGLEYTSKHGTPEERAEAIRQLSDMQIMPLRIH